MCIVVNKNKIILLAYIHYEYADDWWPHSLCGTPARRLYPSFLRAFALSKLLMEGFFLCTFVMWSLHSSLYWDVSSLWQPPESYNIISFPIFWHNISHHQTDHILQWFISWHSSCLIRYNFCDYRKYFYLNVVYNWSPVPRVAGDSLSE